MVEHEPKTAAELMACPEASGFSEKTVLADTPELAKKYNVKLGDTVHIPTVETAWTTPMSPDSIFIVHDHDGNSWRPCYKGPDKGWFREKVMLW